MEVVHQLRSCQVGAVGRTCLFCEFLGMFVASFADHDLNALGGFNFSGGGGKSTGNHSLLVRQYPLVIILFVVGFAGFGGAKPAGACRLAKHIHLFSFITHYDTLPVSGTGATSTSTTSTTTAGFGKPPGRQNTIGVVDAL